MRRIRRRYLRDANKELSKRDIERFKRMSPKQIERDPVYQEYAKANVGRDIILPGMFPFLGGGLAGYKGGNTGHHALGGAIGGGLAGALTGKPEIALLGAGVGAGSAALGSYLGKSLRDDHWPFKSRKRKLRDCAYYVLRRRKKLDSAIRSLKLRRMLDAPLPQTLSVVNKELDAIKAIQNVFGGSKMGALASMAERGAVKNGGKIDNELKQMFRQTQDVNSSLKQMYNNGQISKEKAIVMKEKINKTMGLLQRLKALSASV